MEKALAIKHHYYPDPAPCMFRADGKMEWWGEEPEPTEEQIEQWEVERLKHIESTAYIGLRKAEYPDPMKYNDARVKQHSEDADIRAEGVAQEQLYYDDCLAVKVNIPKP